MRDYQTKNESREGFMEGHDHPWAEGLLCASATCPVREQCRLHDRGVMHWTRFYYVSRNEGAQCPAFLMKP